MKVSEVKEDIFMCVYESEAVREDEWKGRGIFGISKYIKISVKNSYLFNNLIRKETRIVILSCFRDKKKLWWRMILDHKFNNFKLLL